MRRAIRRWGWAVLATSAGMLAYACGGPEGDVLRAIDSDGGAPPDTDAPASSDAASSDAPGDASVVAPGDACAGKDLSADSLNCGGCFHDCQGGACSDGICMPVLVATVESPAGIAVDDNRVYFASTVADGGVYAAQKNGAGKTLLATGLSFPSRLAQAGTRVYFTTEGIPGVVGSVEKDGSQLRILSKTNATPLDVAIEGTSVFFVDLYSASIRKTSVDGEPDAGKAPALASGISYPSGIAAFGGDVFWASRGTFSTPDGGAAGFNGSDGLIQAIGGDGGTPRTLATGRSDPLSVAVDATGVYWVDAMGDRVVKLPAGTSTPVEIASGVPRPWGIALDATHAYVTCRGGVDGTGLLVRVRKDGASSQPEVLASALSFPTTLAVDERAVYFTNTHGSAVMKVAK